MSKKIILVSCAAVLAFAMCLNALQENEKKRAAALLSGLQPRTGQQSPVNVLPPDVARSIVEMATKENEIEFNNRAYYVLRVRVTDYSDPNKGILLADFRLNYTRSSLFVFKTGISWSNISGVDKKIKIPNGKIRISIYHADYPIGSNKLLPRDLPQTEDKSLYDKYLGSILLEQNKVSEGVINNEVKFIEDVPLNSIKEILLYSDSATLTFRDNNKESIKIEYIKYSY